MEEVERFEGSSPETPLFPGEIAVHRSILNCYLFKLEYIFNPKPLHINLRTYSAGNSQLLGQIDVGTVCIQFDRPTRLPAAGT